MGNTLKVEIDTETMRAETMRAMLDCYAAALKDLERRVDELEAEQKRNDNLMQELRERE